MTIPVSEHEHYIQMETNTMPTVHSSYDEIHGVALAGSAYVNNAILNASSAVEGQAIPINGKNSILPTGSRGTSITTNIVTSGQVPLVDVTPNHYRFK